MNTKTTPPNPTAEALASLADIQQVLDASHVIEFPYQVLLAYGALILALPAIELATHFLTFGNPALIGNQWTFALRHVIFYGGVFGAVKFLVLRYSDAWRDLKPTHPLIHSAAGVQSIVLATGLVAVVVLGRAERMDLWIPILFPLVGILFFFFGTFSRGPMKVAAWFQVALGLAYGLSLKDFSNESVWIAFVEVFGLSFIACGAILYRRKRKARDGPPP